MRSLLALALSLSIVFSTQAAPPPLPRDSVYALQAPLVDQSGRAMQLADQRGRAQIVVMFYTACSFICPTIIDTVQDLDRKLKAEERQRLGVLMISLDPRRDGPAALKATADKRGLDLTRWTLAQPRPEDLRGIAGVLGVRYRPLANGEVNHTGVLVLLDAEGRIVARSAKTSGQVEPRFLEQVRMVLMPG
jgi:protein SCO1